MGANQTRGYTDINEQTADKFLALTKRNKMNDVTKKWIDAGMILAKDPSAIVLCPECEKGRLQVKDETIMGLNKVDRYLICENCNKNIILSRLPVP